MGIFQHLTCSFEILRCDPFSFTGSLNTWKRVANMSRHSLHFPWLLCSSECDKISSLPVFHVDEKFTHQVIYFKVSVYPKIDHFSKKKFFSFLDRSYCNLTLPPQGFGPEAKTRGGTLGSPACIHIRNSRKTRNLKKVRNVLVVGEVFSIWWN